MCSGSEAGSYLRLIDFVYHSTLDLRVIKKKDTCCAGGKKELKKMIDHPRQVPDGNLRKVNYWSFPEKIHQKPVIGVRTGSWTGPPRKIRALTPLPRIQSS